MRWVSLPEELAIPHLLDLPLGPHPLHPSLARSRATLVQGAFDSALHAANQAFEIAKRQHDRYAGALSLILRAETLRRLMRWEESLDALRLALHWLELDVSPVARHNEAMAVYLEGVIHYTLRADEKVTATFAYAQSTLLESARYWDFEQHTRRAADCRNVIRWLAQLGELQGADLRDPLLLVMPAYELVSCTLVRTGAIALPPFRPMIPDKVVARYCPPEVAPLRLETVVFLDPSPERYYAAVRFTDNVCLTDVVGLGGICKGDLLILEVTGLGPGSGELVLTWDRTFVRSDAGHVAFHLAPGTSDLASPSVGSGLMGIPRVLIKDLEAR